MKKIPRPDIANAVQLTPMEMNDLHFKLLATHSPIKSPGTDKK